MRRKRKSIPLNIFFIYSLFGLDLALLQNDVTCLVMSQLRELISIPSLHSEQHSLFI